MRKWQQAAAAVAAAPHYFLHRLRCYRRHGHRLLQAPSPPPPPCIVANEGHATGSPPLPFIGRCCCCRLPHLPRTKVVGRRWSVGPMASEPNRGRRTTKRPSSSLRLTAPAPGDSGYDFLTAAAPVGGGQHEVRTDGGAGPRRHSARAHASLLCRIISR